MSECACAGEGAGAGVCGRSRACVCVRGLHPRVPAVSVAEPGKFARMSVRNLSRNLALATSQLVGHGHGKCECTYLKVFPSMGFAKEERIILSPVSAGVVVRFFGVITASPTKKPAHVTKVAMSVCRAKSTKTVSCPPKISKAYYIQ